MMIALNETHDPARRSFVASANAADSEFPIQNLPFGVFRPAAGLPAGVGVAIGDQILDVAAAASAFDGLAAEAAAVCAAPSTRSSAVARAAGLVGVAARFVARLERTNMATSACGRI